MKGQPDRANNGSTRDLNSDDNIMQGNGEHQQRIELQTSEMLLINNEAKAREEVLEECRAKMRELEKMMNALGAAEKMNGPRHIKSADHNSTSKLTALQLLQGRYWTPGMDSRQAQSVPGTPAEPPGGGLVQVASFRSLCSGGGGGGGSGEGRGGRRYRLGSDDSTSPHGADSYPPYFTKYDQEATDSPLVNNGRVSQGKVVLKSLHRRQLHELKSAGSSRPGSPAAEEERPWSTGRSPSGSRQPHGARSAGVPSLKVPVEGGGAEEGEVVFERVPSIELPLGGGGGEEVGARAVAGSGEKGSSDGRTATGGLRRRRTVDSYVDTSDNEQLVKITRIHSEKRAESFFSDTGEDEGLRRVAAEGRPHGISLLEYLKFEIIGASVQPDRGEKVEQDLANFAAVPRRLEPLLAYGTAICTDTFLYVVTFLPLRFLASLYLLVRHLLTLLAGALLGRVAGWLGRPGPLLRRRRTSSAWYGGGGGGGGGVGQMRRFHRSHLYDVMRFLAVLAGVLSLQNVRMSILYHYIRGQGMLKLYVITAMMETLDKLLCSIGQDALDALYRSTRRKDRAIALNFLAVIAYVVIHSVLLFVHIATLNVAVNSSEKSLMALLISNNFNEMKGSVLKKFDRKNLFQLACADIVERFKLMLFLFLIVLLNYCQGMQDAVYRVVTKVALWVLGGEVLADWVKHAFIAKFNSIPSSVYPEYAAMLSVDLTSCRQGGVILDHTYAVTRRLGFAQLPLTCVFLRLVQTAGPAFRVSFAPSKAGLALIALLTYLCLLAFKVLTGILLQAYAYTPTVEELRSPSLARHGPGRRAAGDQVRASNVEKLSIIERFTLWKGRIV